MDKIQFWKPYQANQSFIVFSSNLSEKHVIQNLQSINAIKLAATKIRKSLNKFTFNFKSKLCDAKKRKNSWNNAYILHELIYFFSNFFNIPQSYLCSYQVDLYNIEDGNDGLDFAKIKVMKIKSPYQILYYSLHGEKEERPLHLFIAHSVYKRYKSRQVLIPLNKVGVSVGYEVQRLRNDLTYFTYFQSKKEGVTNPSHVSKDEYAIGVFVTFDHRDRPSLSGKFSNHVIAMILFQIKSKKPPKKLMKHKSTILK